MSFEKFKTYLSEKAGITIEQLEELTPQLRSKSIGKGKYVLRPGEICRHSFFVEEGLLRAYTIDDSGKEHIVQFAPENWFISDRSSAFFNEPSDYYIEAVENTNVVLIDYNFIAHISEISKPFRAYNEKLLQNHIRHLQQRVTLLLGASAKTRYLDFIRLYADLTLRVPQWMIASYLGITAESLSRVRKELAQENFKPH